MTDIKLNYYYYIAILETIKLWANRIISVRQQYIKPFNNVLTNNL